MTEKLNILGKNAEFALIDFDVKQQLKNPFESIVECDSLTIFTKRDLPDGFVDVPNKKIVKFPEEVDNLAKSKNFVNKYYQDGGFRGFLHVFENGISFKKNPGIFMSMLQHVMSTLDYSVWLNTACDPCNYVYAKYNPRVAVKIDDEKYQKLQLPNEILFTSHSNTTYVVYDMEKVDSDLLKFKEEFSIPMYYILEFLARRRNTKKNGEMYMMNQYLTIPGEFGLFKFESVEQPLDQTRLKEEDVVFKSMNIDMHPDNNIDQLLADLHAKLEAKIR